jgi:hypothetical protein
MIDIRFEHHVCSDCGAGAARTDGSGDGLPVAAPLWKSIVEDIGRTDNRYKTYLFLEKKLMGTRFMT